MTSDQEQTRQFMAQGKEIEATQEAYLIYQDAETTCYQATSQVNGKQCKMYSNAEGTLRITMHGGKIIEMTSALLKKAFAASELEGLLAATRQAGDEKAEAIVAVALAN